MPAATISGRVVDAAGRPVAGATVYAARSPVPLPDIAALTDRDGRFTLAAPQPGRYEIACRSEALGNATAEVSVPGARGAAAPQASVEVEIRLGPG